MSADIGSETKFYLGGAFPKPVGPFGRRATVIAARHANRDCPPAGDPAVRGIVREAHSAATPIGKPPNISLSLIRCH
jgi:hypothetical protein